MNYVFQIFSDDYITDSKNALLYYINDKLKKIINKIDRNKCNTVVCVEISPLNNKI